MSGSTFEDLVRHGYNLGGPSDAASGLEGGGVAGLLSMHSAPPLPITAPGSSERAFAHTARMSLGHQSTAMQEQQLDLFQQRPVHNEQEPHFLDQFPALQGGHRLQPQTSLPPMHQHQLQQQQYHHQQQLQQYGGSSSSSSIYSRRPSEGGAFGNMGMGLSALAPASAASAPLQSTPSGSHQQDFQAPPGAGTAMVAPYFSDVVMTRLSHKMFNRTPDDLPPDLQSQLAEVMRCGNNDLQGYIRPGCAHLTVDAGVAAPQQESLQSDGVRAAAHTLFAASSGKPWSQAPSTMQLFDEAALVSHGRVLHVVSVTGSAAVLPHLISVSPRFLIAGSAYAAVIRSANYHPSIDAVIARADGRDLEVEVLPSPVPQGGNQVEHLLWLPGGAPVGMLTFEVARGAVLSTPVRTVALPLQYAAAIDELQTLPISASSEDEVSSVVCDLARILQLDELLREQSRDVTSPQQLSVNRLRRPFSPLDVASTAAAAQRLLMVACRQGWYAVARMVLPIACAANERVADVIAALIDVCACDNACPLALAKCSGSKQLVKLLLVWAREGGTRWPSPPTIPEQCSNPGWLRCWRQTLRLRHLADCTPHSSNLGACMKASCAQLQTRHPGFWAACITTCFISKTRERMATVVHTLLQTSLSAIRVVFTSGSRVLPAVGTCGIACRGSFDEATHLSP